MPSTKVRTSLVRSLEPQVRGRRTDVDCGTGYEALLGLVMFAGHEPPGDYDVGPGWFDRVGAQASAALRRDVERLCGGVPTVFGHLLGLVRRCPEPRDLAALVDLVATLPSPQLRLELLGSAASRVVSGVTPAVLEGAAAGDRNAVAELLTAGDERWARSVRAVLALSPERASDLTCRVLRRWGKEVFHEQEAGLAPRLRAQAESWRIEATRSGWREVIESASGGIVVGEDLPANNVLLVPTVLGAPWVYSTERHGTRIFCCPVREQTEPTVAQAVALLRALGDETRLAILRQLSTGGQATLAELTSVLEMSKSAVHKHVMLLRSAGLVRVTIGRERRYALREIPDLTGILDHLIRADR